MQSIFEYSEYREFLKDSFDEKKSIDAKYSYRFFALKADINSSGFFKLIIEGKRNLTKITIVKTCKAFELNGTQAEYFENLVFFNQAKTVEEKNHFFERLILAQKKSKQEPLSRDRFQYFSEWYHPVVRELAVMPDLQGNAQKISQRIHPKIPLAKVEASIQLLLELNFLAKKGKSYIQTQPTLSTGAGIFSHELINYQIKNLKLAQQAFDIVKANERLHSSTTLGVSKKTFDLMVKKSRKFREQLQEIAEQDTHADNVYLLQMSLFPLSQNET
tara:strand:- start:3901 stop:4722 length:822 start_codon:yes stop_codon:yes gene_type:complete